MKLVKKEPVGLDMGRRKGDSAKALIGSLVVVALGLWLAWLLMR